MNKKLLGFGLACAMVASVGAISVGCCGSGNDGIDAQDFYAMAAVSSVNYLQTESATQNVSAMDATERPATISDADVGSLASYMDMFRGMMSSENNFYSNGEVEEGDDYFGTYNLKMTMRIPTLDGGTEEFTMYYKEVNSETKEEIDDNEIELEINTTLEGVIEVGSETFQVSGMREYEREGNETEISIEFRTWSAEAPNDYIEIEHGAEDGEIEYEYSIYQNNRPVSKTEVEYENERNRKTLELEFVNESAQSEVKYEITQSRNNENQFDVRVKSSTNENDVRESFTITVGETGYVFNYSNGFQETVAF